MRGDVARPFWRTRIRYLRTFLETDARMHMETLPGCQSDGFIQIGQ